MNNIAKWLFLTWIASLLLMPTVYLVYGYVGSSMVSLSSITPYKKTPSQLKEDLKWRYPKIRNAAGTDAILAIDQYASFSSVRYLSASLFVPKDAVKDGAASTYQASAAVLAPLVAENECSVIKEYFASDCEVTSSKAEENSQGISFRIKLKFVQNGQFPNIDRNSEKRLDDIVVSYELKEQKHNPSFDIIFANKRREIYNNIKNDCNHITQKYGNCAIYRVDIGESAARYARDPEDEFTIRASYSAHIATIRDL